MRKVVKLIGIIALAAVVGFSMAACGDDGGGNGSSTQTTPSLSIQGKFNKGQEEVRFKLTENNPSPTVMPRSAAAMKAINGVIVDDAITFNLTGTYEPNTGKYTASAASSIIRYTIAGTIDAEGIDVGSTATLLVKSGDDWIATSYVITPAASVDITGTPGTPASGGLPSNVRGIWNFTETYGSFTHTIRATANQWDVDIQQTSLDTTDGTSTTDTVKASLISITSTGNTHEVIYAFPQYNPTVAQAKNAVEQFFGKNNIKFVEGYINIDDPGNLVWPTTDGLYFYIHDGDPNNRYVGFISVGEIPDSTWKKVDQFYMSNAMQRYLISQNVQPITLYQKARFRLVNNSTLEWNIYFNSNQEEVFTNINAASSYNQLNEDLAILLTK